MVTMNTTAAFRIIPAMAIVLMTVAPAYAFQDDYVWQERFKTQSALADKGNADAQYDIGEMYEKGSGVATDVKKAFHWFEKAAAQGHVKAQFKVAYMYYKGQGVDGNIHKAFTLMDKPANEGNVRAQYYLAQMYANGDGVKADLEEAFTWFSRSSLGGYKPADEALSELKKTMAAASERARKEEERVARRDEETAVKNIAKTTPAVAPKAAAKTAPTVPATPAAKPESVAAAPAPAVASTQVATVEGFQPAMQTHSTTASVLLNGAWNSIAKTPAEFLPSKITSCHKASETVIECISEDLQRTIAGTEIVYQTKAIVYAMKKDGDFKIAYRNNVTKILNAKESEEQVTGSGDTSSVKLGWQETEHRLECKVDPEQTINCVKNKTQKVTLKNQTMS